MTISLAILLGLGLVMLMIFFPRVRLGIAYIFAGMIFWGILELMRFGIQYIFNISMMYSYFAALLLLMIGATFMLLRQDRLEQKSLAKRRHMEHSPVYQDKS